MASIGVLFVCLGNICRSPAAEAMFAELIARRGLGARIHADSCATASFHAGKAPDPRAVAAAGRLGYRIAPRLARQITDADFRHFRYLVAMDRNNLRTLQGWAPPDFAGEIELLTRYCADAAGQDVADPFYGSAEAFDDTLALIERGVGALLEQLCRRHRL